MSTFTILFFFVLATEEHSFKFKLWAASRFLKGLGGLKSFDTIEIHDSLSLSCSCHQFISQGRICPHSSWQNATSQGVRARLMETETYCQSQKGKFSRMVTKIQNCRRICTQINNYNFFATFRVILQNIWNFSNLQVDCQRRYIVIWTL